jgi:PKD repeat protein
MNSKTRGNRIINFIVKLTSAGCLFIATALICRGQTQIYGNQLNLLNVNVLDQGTAAPTPGANDQYQTNLPVGSSNPGTLNYYWTQGWLNNSFAPQAPGQSFTTGNNPNGYILNSMKIQANTFNHAGGQYTFPFILNIYALSSPDSSQTGSPNTNATLLAGFENQVVTPVTYGDWVQFTNLSVVLAPNTQYAYTISTTMAGENAYANVSFVNGNPYAGGETLAISLQGNNAFVNYGGAYTYDATFDAGLAPATVLTINPPTATTGNPVSQGTAVTLNAGIVAGNTGIVNYQWQTDGGSGNTPTNVPGATTSTLNAATTGAFGNYTYDVVATDSAAHVATSPVYVLSIATNLPGTIADLGAANPTLGNYDISQLIGGYVPSGSGADTINYYADTGAKSGSFVGQTFTTGTNVLGYQMGSVSIKMASGTSSATTTAKYYDLMIYSVNGASASLLAHVTNSPSFGYNYGDWIKWSFPAINLRSNAVYAYTFGQTLASGWGGLSASPYQVYQGGQIASIPASGGAVTYNSNNVVDGTFNVGLFPVGVPIVLNAPIAAPNPVYALTPITITSSAQTTGAYTYQWLTDDGSGATPPNYITISGQTSSNLMVTPLNLGNGSDYTTNFYVRISDGVPADTATSLPVTVTVHPATLAQFTSTPALTNLVTFVGQNLSYSVSEIGTLPITNQWQFNNGGGYVGLSLQTNTTLNLNNLQVTNSGNYQVVAKNVVGTTNSSSVAPVTLVVTADPPPPATTEKYAYSVYTNIPYAYWRLNETNDPTAPGAPVYMAYDYSGNNFNATYLSAVTVNNPGPSPLLSPGFPGFSTNELAAGTFNGYANGILTVPNLNLTNTSTFVPMTFVAWVNPNGPTASSAGLLFNRGGPGSATGFGFGGTSGNLGYTINNNSGTYNFNSGLAVQQGQWNFVAYVVTQTNATLALGYLTSDGNPHFTLAINSVTNAPTTLGVGTTWLGGDPNSSGRIFNGFISEAALFTNALSVAQLEQFFLTGIGSSANVSLPTVFPTSVYPASEVPAGQNVLLTGSFVSPQNPTGLQWQAGPDGSTWTNYTGATAGTLLLNLTNPETIYFQLVVTNPAGSATSSPPVSITFDQLPSTPAGLWTANYEVTNNLFNSGYYAYALAGPAGGTGHYVGRGILGNGSAWNYIPYVTSTVGVSKNIVSANDLRDDGTTHSGVLCYLNSTVGGSSQTAHLPNTSDIGNLLYQWVTILNPASALQFKGVPNGTYNLAIYSEFGATANLGTIFVVNDPLNGNQTNSTLNTSTPVVPLGQNGNYVLFTGVHVSGGTLNVDAYPNPAASGVNINVEADINGAQLQLVSYDPPVASLVGSPTNAFVGQVVTFTNTSTGAVTNSVWNFGDTSPSVTNTSTATVSHTYTSVGTYSVSLTVTGPGGGPSSATNLSYISTLPPTTISSAKVTNGRFILLGGNGPVGTQYRILTTTNVALPLASWTPVWTNMFASDGSYGYTNSSVTNAQRFYRMVSP